MPPRSKSSASIDPYLGRKLGNVKLTAKLGQGGMGLVYRGWHEGFRQDVAVKVLPDRTHQGAQLERFIREGRAAAAIQHPNVVRVMDAGNEDGTSYLVLELVDGSSLGDILDAKPEGLEARVVEGLGRGIAKGLEAIHAAGIIHRDIKPDNLLLGKNGMIKITDLGLARQVNDPELNRLTATGMVVGTPLYVAPEAIRDNKTSGEASDIYSLGATLYHMLAGKPPLTGATPYDVMRAHLELRPRPVRELKPDAPAWMADLIDACLIKDPARRPGIAQVVAVLERRNDLTRSGSRLLTLVLVAAAVVGLAALASWSVLHSRSTNSSTTAESGTLLLEPSQALEQRQVDGSWAAVSGPLHLPAGEHELNLRSAGFGPRMHGTVHVAITAGQETRTTPALIQGTLAPRSIAPPPASSGIWYRNGDGAGLLDGDLCLDRPGRWALGRWAGPGGGWWSCIIDTDAMGGDIVWDTAPHPGGPAWYQDRIQGETAPSHHLCCWQEVELCRLRHGVAADHLWQQGAGQPLAPALGLGPELVVAVEQVHAGSMRLPTAAEAALLSRLRRAPHWQRDAQGLGHAGDGNGAASLLALLPR